MNIRYTEDVKETLHLAERFARKRLKTEEVSRIQDREYLLALLLSSRPFSRLDSLCRQMTVRSRDIARRLEQAMKTSLRSAPGQEPAASTVLETAGRLLEAELQRQGRQTGYLAVDHLLDALCQSADPLVWSVFREFGVDADRLSAARQRLLEKGRVPLARKDVFSLLYFLRESAEIVVVVLFFLIVIKEGLGELRLIPTESMVPTLQVEDRLVIEKVARWFRPYQRGDILVFYPPEPESILPQDPISVFLRMTGFSALIHNRADDPIDKAFIKRLIGLPGEMVQVVPGRGVYINGTLLKEPYVREIAQDCGRIDDEPFYFCTPRQVPAGHFFMMGDNRNQSRDGRYFGYEPADRVVGRAVFRIMPLHRIGGLEAKSPSGP